MRRGAASLLWPAEKATRIDVASESTGRHTAKIVDATCIRAVVKAWPSRPARIRITGQGRRPVLRSLILLDNLAG